MTTPVLKNNLVIYCHQGWFLISNKSSQTGSRSAAARTTAFRRSPIKGTMFQPSPLPRGTSPVMKMIPGR
ncbi:hypothetical protein OROGR_034151 [Orobanche gracilis]